MFQDLSTVISVIYLVRAANAFHSYGPEDVACPFNHNITREAHWGLDQREKNWLASRDNVTQQVLKEWLERSSFPDVDIAKFLDNNNDPRPIRVGISISGGGFRAMLSGAGMVAALDSNIPDSVSHGLGGLLQASTYISALSGGAWLLGSLATNNWTSVEKLQQSQNLWNFQKPFSPSKKDPLGIRYDFSIMRDLQDKANGNFPITLTDIWGRLLGAQLFDEGIGHGRGVLWSDLVRKPGMCDFSMPMPIIISDGIDLRNKTELNAQEAADIKAGDHQLPVNSTIYEVTPFEFGSWDSNVDRFIDTMYIGTETINGTAETLDCTIGYDNTGFLIGTSSSIFNEMLNEIAIGPLKSFLDRLDPEWLQVGKIMDLALISPNPFLEIENTLNTGESKNLGMVDGGENGENIPLSPLLQEDRGVDVIFSFDSSSDTPEGWPDGTALVKTYERQLLENSDAFPYITSTSDVVAQGINKRPSFLGCSVDTFANTTRPIQPVIVYIPNSEYTFLSNTSTFKLSYSNSDRDAMIRNGFNAATQNNGTSDSNWKSCVACAIILRSQQRQQLTPSSQCQACYQRYCFESNGNRQAYSPLWDPDVFNDDDGNDQSHERGD